MVAGGEDAGSAAAGAGFDPPRASPILLLPPQRQVGKGGPEFSFKFILKYTVHTEHN